MKIIDKKEVVLEPANLEVFESYIEALHEGFVRGDAAIATKEEIKQIVKDPTKYLDNIDKTPAKFTAPNGETFDRVPGETLWLSNGKTFIGEVSFRFELNRFLEEYGGHVGYGIKPSLSGQGLGTLALKLTKERAKKIGITKLLVTCSPDNPASEKIILNNGGIYQDTLDNPFGCEAIKRYWITIE